MTDVHLPDTRIVVHGSIWVLNSLLLDCGLAVILAKARP